MAGRKRATENNEEVQNVQFDKSQILAAERYQSHRDLVNALLDDQQKYTLDSVDKMIDEFMKGKVK